jgi:hypothetical protein
MSQEDDDLKEENQRTMKFILEQQAQFTVDMQQLREAQAQAEERWGRTEDGIRSLLAIAEIHEGEIKTLAEAQTALAEAQTATAEATAATADAQARTDSQMAETAERLNALINVVEQLISERRRNGSAGESGSRDDAK